MTTAEAVLLLGIFSKALLNDPSGDVMLAAEKHLKEIAPIVERITIKNLIVKEAEAKGVDAEMLYNVAVCESNLRDVYGDRGKAYGIFQFWRGTFDKFKEEAGMPDLKYESRDDQIKLAAWAFANDKKSHWTCARKL